MSASISQNKKVKLWISIAIFAISISACLGVRMKKSEPEIQKVADIPEENPNPVLRISCDYKALYAVIPERLLILLFSIVLFSKVSDDTLKILIKRAMY